MTTVTMPVFNRSMALVSAMAYSLQ